MLMELLTDLVVRPARGGPLVVVGVEFVAGDSGLLGSFVHSVIEFRFRRGRNDLSTRREPYPVGISAGFGGGRPHPFDAHIEIRARVDVELVSEPARKPWCLAGPGPAGGRTLLEA